MKERRLQDLVLTAMADTPVVLIHGPRQGGKTTLARAIAARRRAGFVTLDDAGTLASALNDPQGFLADRTGCLVIDEVQRVPDLFRAIKLAVDQDRRPGKFLLTGSAQTLLLPRLSESLAGRMETLTLWPFAQAEIEGRNPCFLDHAFAEGAFHPPSSAETRTGLLGRILAGGFPEAQGRTSDLRRRAWFSSYLSATIQRDIRDLARIEGLSDLPRLTELAAARSAGLLNLADLARDAGLSYMSLRRYLVLLETTFLLAVIPAWSTNAAKRAVKAPKLVVCDSGVLAHLLGLTPDRLAGEPAVFGRLFESFVIMELRKLADSSAGRPRLFHYREHSGEEVDAVLEDAGGGIVGVEVKTRQNPEAGDFRGLHALAARCGRRFRRGIVIHTGRQHVPFGGLFHAVPVSALWS